MGKVLSGDLSCIWTDVVTVTVAGKQSIYMESTTKPLLVFVTCLVKFFRTENPESSRECIHFVVVS